MTKKESRMKGRRFTNKDQVELAVLVCYMVQTRGNMSIKDMLDYLHRGLNSRVAKQTLFKVAEQLRSRKFLVANYIGAERCFSMARVQFNAGSMTEVAHTHIDGLISSLTADPAGIAIAAEIGALLGVTGPGGKPGKGGKPRKYPREWATYTAKLQLLEPWLGAWPIVGNALLKRMYDLTPEYAHLDLNCDPKEIPLVFLRGRGGLIVHADCVRGFIEKHLPSLGMSPMDVRNFYLGSIVIKPSLKEEQLKVIDEEELKALTLKDLSVYKSPIQRPASHTGGGMAAEGAGFGFYEAVMPGTIVEWKFDAPTVNWPTPEQIEWWLRSILDRSHRSLSPARGGQTGAAELLSLDIKKWPPMFKQDDGNGNGDSDDVDEEPVAVAEDPVVVVGEGTDG